MGSDDTFGAVGLAFGVLGPLRVLHRGEPVALGGRRQRAVLARLLVDPTHVVSRSALVEAVWGESAPRGHAATLQTYVFHLRETLEPDRAHGAIAKVLVTESGGYRLAVPNGQVDVTRFQRLVAEGQALSAHGDYAGACAELTDALALWRGPVLADLVGLEFVAPLSSWLDQLRLDATEARLDAMLRLGRHAEVATEVGDLVAQHPLRERLYALHMLALFRCGRQAEALTAFTDLRRILVEELGIEPSPPLRELHARTLAQDPTLVLTPPSAARPLAVDRRERDDTAEPVSSLPTTGRPARLTSRVASVRLPAQRSSFVGREVELAEGLELLHGRGC
jgi:DNA-binding SARP family transcriptional activator